MSAPQPGTPLPWAVTLAKPRKVHSNGVLICTAVIRNMATTAQNKHGKTVDDAGANAAYIVHACNNYPKAQALADALREAAIEVAAALAAAISLLERGGKAAKRAAPSDRMFDEMVADYKARLERARSIIAAWDAKS